MRKIFLCQGAQAGIENERKHETHEYCRIGVYCSAARFLLTSLSSEIVSFVPLPFGNDIHGLIPSPMTKIFDTLRGKNDRSVGKKTRVPT
jgi:hypothetical protein